MHLRKACLADLPCEGQCSQLEGSDFSTLKVGQNLTMFDSIAQVISRREPIVSGRKSVSSSTHHDVSYNITVEGPDGKKSVYNDVTPQFLEKNKSVLWSRHWFVREHFLQAPVEKLFVAPPIALSRALIPREIQIRGDTKNKAFVYRLTACSFEKNRNLTVDQIADKGEEIISGKLMQQLEYEYAPEAHYIRSSSSVERAKSSLRRTSTSLSFLDFLVRARSIK